MQRILLRLPSKITDACDIEAYGDSSLLLDILYSKHTEMSISISTGPSKEYKRTQ